MHSTFYDRFNLLQTEKIKFHISQLQCKCNISIASIMYIFIFFIQLFSLIFTFFFKTHFLDTRVNVLKKLCKFVIHLLKINVYLRKCAHYKIQFVIIAY